MFVQSILTIYSHSVLPPEVPESSSLERLNIEL